MSRSAVIVQARMGSSRLPGKVMKMLQGKTFLEHCLDRCRRVPGIDEVVCATSTNSDCDVIVDLCRKRGYAWFRGSETDCVDRYYRAAVAVRADVVSRATSDNPFVDPAVIAETFTALRDTGSDYVATHLIPRLPYGLDAETFTFNALEITHRHATDPQDREHVTSWMRGTDRGFQIANVDVGGPWSRDVRLSLDTEEDLTLLTRIADQYRQDLNTVGWEELVTFVRGANIAPAAEARL